MKNAKKRILCIVTQADWGGVQAYLVRFAKEAVARGNEVLIVAGGDGLLYDHCEKNGVTCQKLLRMEREISPWKDIGALQELISLIKSWKPDTLYLHSSKAGVIGSIAGKLTGIKHIVYRIGGWSFLDPVSFIQKQFRIWSERLTAPLKDVIITLHPQDEDIAKRLWIRPSKRIVMIPNGLDLKAFDAKAISNDEAKSTLEKLWRMGIRESGIANRNTPILLTVANFYATKDLVRYLDAISIAAKTIPDIRVLIVGEGSLRKEIEAKRQELNLDNIVSLPGADDQIQRLMHAADLFILPSAKEGMPWTLLEAMASRIPCIATDVGACKWMLDGGGWIVPPKNPEALAEAIVNALSDQEKAKHYGDMGRNVIETRFLESNMWDDTFRVLNQD